MKRFSANWIEPDPVEVNSEILDFIGEPRLLSEILVKRGITQKDQAKAFLDPRFYRPAPPSDFPDMEKAVNRIIAALQNGDRIGIWGDFDVDGQTSTALLVSSLRKLGADVIYHVPVRERESHGINLPNLNTMLEKDVKLFISCDTGITAHEAVNHINMHGREIIITDHHTLPAQLPDAYAVINPQLLPENHPSRSLAGVGTAYKLVEELFSRQKRSSEVGEYLDLVALGCVADVALLKGDTRYYVQLGLQQLRKNQRLGLKILNENAEINPGQVNEEQIGFALAPRLNALGRLGDANPIVELFTTGDETTARIIANNLEGLNARRKLLCDQVYKGALAQVEREPGLLDAPILILSHPEWHAGVIGIVASRLVDLFQRPVILLSNPPGQAARGSARSIEGINITAAISANAGLLNGFGGHPMAAGLSLPQENLDSFRRAIQKTILEIAGENQSLSSLYIDAYLPFDRLTIDFVEQLDRLAPFGAGNPPITMATRNIVIRETSVFGKTREHLKIILQDELGNSRQVTWWQGAGSPLPEGQFDLAYTCRATNYRGEVSVSLEWIAAREIENVSIDLDRTRAQILDCRSSINPLQDLSAIKQSHQDLIIYSEGGYQADIQGQDRDHLRPAQTLVIWTPPPGVTEFQTILQKVNPVTLVLFNNPSASDHLPGFQKQLLGLLKYALNHHAGRLSLSKLAATCNQREITVQTGLDYLCARGLICLIPSEDEMIHIAEGGIINDSKKNLLEQELTSLLQETAAFRTYYARSAPENLLPK